MPSVIKQRIQLPLWQSINSLCITTTLMMLSIRSAFALQITQYPSNPYFTNTGTYIQAQTASNYQYIDPDTNQSISLNLTTALTSFGSGKNYTYLSSKSIKNSLGFLGNKSLLDLLIDPNNPNAFQNTTRQIGTGLTLPGWTFNVSNRSLNGTFNILNYFACAPISQQNPNNTKCGTGVVDQANIPVSDRNPKSNVVGSSFLMTYEPGIGDPVVSSKLHWLQFVFNLTDDPIDHLGKKTPFYIDNRNSLLIPYYGGSRTTSGVLTSSNNPPIFYFADSPTRERLSFDRSWIAFLFLVEEVQTGNVSQNQNYIVNIYDGISWGWKTRLSQHSPAPLSSTPPGYPPPSNPHAVCPPGAYVGPTLSCEFYGYREVNALVSESLLNFDEPAAQLPSSNPSPQATESSTSVPEPGSVLGLLAVGAWAGISWRKKKDNHSVRNQ
jgi:hypothetical protein